MGELIVSSKMACVRHEADHAYSVRCNWLLYQLSANESFVAWYFCF